MDALYEAVGVETAGDTVVGDEAAALGASLRGLTAAGETLGALVDAIDRQCREVLSRLFAAPERGAGVR